MFDPGAMLDEVDDYELGDAQDAVLKGNAARLLGLDIG
jgi:hypothetical protein